MEVGALPGKVDVCVLLSTELFQTMVVPPVAELLDSFSRWHHVPVDGQVGEDELVAMVADADAVLNGWRSPFFGPAIIGRAPRLRFMGYAAGSVKPAVAAETMRAGLTVCSAATIMARYVGEMALLLTLALIRRLPENQREMKVARSWKAMTAIDTDSLFGLRVGLVGFGVTAREFVKLLAPFAPEIVVHDPFLDPAEARTWNVGLTSLEEVLSTSRVVSLHAPDLPGTQKMLDRRRLAMLADGAILINTARGRLIDEDALLAELRSGRIRAGLDVFANEPLPADSPLRDLGDNVLLSTHVAGPAYRRRWEMALAMAEEMKAFFAGRPLRYQVRPEKMEIMA